ncbi:hypothetical protein O9993_05950 [Vibrio lentus]|nr:hypothetical protein [Vibrio lentus]
MLDTRDAIALHVDARIPALSRSIRVEIMAMDYLDEETLVIDKASKGSANTESDQESFL